ncbi:hypothetical protein CEE37_02315 [candidate division LCP-89 bacterium B3_LCP]|uniref:Lipopolysaccharide heptosyltransferase II n=1 Tax=candidate division LCP-89 bacterium B3_LCP TaxID=2012998 RepID=A0A532V5R3_UNCL8|nr:MAG: hypothetical protein CEE37_02315 [candidate division LCP-89 bacterium B3_LCP]
MLPRSTSNDSFLVIRLSSLGDVLLTTPALRCLRKTYPQSHIDVIVRERYVELLRGNPNISSVIPLPEPADRKTIRNVAETMESRYDTVIDLHTGFRSTYLRRLLKPERALIYHKRRLVRWLKVRLKLDLYGDEFSVPLAYLKCLQPLNVKDDNLGMEWQGALLQKDQFLEKAKLAYPSEVPTIALCPGASFASKRWPVENWCSLAAELLKENFNLWIIGDNSDKTAGDQIRSVNPEHINNFCGLLSFAQSGAALSLCNLAITHDAGPSHMAAAVKTPLVAIFGSTVLQFGFRPFRIPHRIAEVNVTCRPCSHLGFDRCPKDHFRCMKDITSEHVLQLVKDLLSDISQ